MKKLLAFVLAAAMVFTLTACGGGSTPTTEAPKTTTTAATPGTTASGQTTAATPETTAPPAPAANEVTDWVHYLTQVNEMETFNILFSQANKELQVLTNCIDGLLSNDNYGNLVPGLAEKWETTDGGKTWTFHLRDGVKWVDVKGTEKADVTAEDFLWGLEWVLNFHKNEAANTSMPIEMIQGAGEYYEYTKNLDEAAGKALGIDKLKEMVGIEAKDAKTLVYTCVDKLPYFDTLTTYNCLYPAAPKLIEELGVDGFKACDNQNMWYCGPYVMPTFVRENEKVMTPNPLYWNKDCKRFNSVTYKMVESGAQAYQMYENGELSYVELTEDALNTIHTNTNHQFYQNLVEARPTKYSYQIHLNWNKNMEKSEEPDTNWNTAVQNEAFRLALYYGLDATPYLERTNSINPLKCANYCYTMSQLVNFSNGQEYTERVMELIGITPSLESFPRYDAEKAAQYKKQAMEELAAKGVTFPVLIDYYISGSSTTAADTAFVFGEMIKKNLGDDFVKLNTLTYVSSLANEVRKPRKASIYINGWGADYGDPQNYLGQETYGEDNAYYSISYVNTNDITEPELIETYKEFTKMVNDAKNITDDMDKRYEAYAQAEAFMLKHALCIPWYKNVSWQLTHVNDYTKIYAPYGIQTNRFVNWETSKDGYTTADYDAFAAAYEAGAGK